MGASASVSTCLCDASAFEGASLKILDEIEHKGSISPEEAANIVSKYNRVAHTVRQWFPRARDGKYVLRDVKRVLDMHHVTAVNTLYAQSVCPDEINHEKGDITQLFCAHIGEVFHLGGLAGIPFTGKTGFTAFKHHVPDNGHLFLLMASHIGITEDEVLGMYSRDGQSACGSACGAACGALQTILNDLNHPNPDCNTNIPEDDADYQFQYLLRALRPRIQAKSELFCSPTGEGKTAGNAKQAQLAVESYEIALDMLQRCVDVEFGGADSKLIILAGVQLNMPRPMNDFFQPRAFYILQKNKQREDLFDMAFPDAMLIN